MWLIAGTVPDDNFGLCVEGLWQDSKLEDDNIVLPDGRKLPIGRGTTALAAAAMRASVALGKPLPRLLLVGDEGTGAGSDRAYAWIQENIADVSARFNPLKGITFHYFYPDLDGHNRVFMAVEDLHPKPILVADAGFMYVAKMSGFAGSYDLFTPDIGELAFLADEKAPHPFYTRGFLLADESDWDALLQRALSQGNCPQNMIIKGKVDHILCQGKVIADVAKPAVEAMESIGGTGDIVTGLATAYLAAGNPICKSALWAARAARQLAQYCRPTPATQATELIAHIGEVLRKDRSIIERD